MLDGAVTVLTHWSKGNVHRSNVDDWMVHDIFSLADEVVEHASQKAPQKATKSSK